MKSKTYLSALPLASVTALNYFAIPAAAVDVLFVTDGSPIPTNDIRDVLTSAGYTVTDFDGETYDWNLGLNDGIDYANGFDLIVHSRNVDGVYNLIRGQGAIWNALTTPAIILDVYRVGGEFSGNSWSWGTPVNSGNPSGTNAGDTYTVTVPTDPILSGITLTDGETPALLSGAGRYWDLGAGADPVEGVTVIAHQPGNTQNVAIAYAAPGALREGGAAQYFMVGGNSGGSDENIFTPDGEKVFLNAVAILLGNIGSDYNVWAALFPGADLRDPDGDFDKDGANNDYERLFGLDPTDPSSIQPISVQLDSASGTFSFTRRDDALTGAVTVIETSSNLIDWNEDTGASLVAGTPDAQNIQVVEVTLSPELINNPKLFVRVRQ